MSEALAARLDSTRTSYFVGVILVLMAGVFWSSMGLGIRMIEQANVWQILFYRSIALAIFLFSIITIRSGFKPLRAIRSTGFAGVIGGVGLVVAFAAETNDVEYYARRKRARKHADFIVANEVGRAGVGFGSDANAVLLISASGDSENIGPDSKEAVAERLVDRFAASLAERGFARCRAVEG